MHKKLTLISFIFVSTIMLGQNIERKELNKDDFLYMAKKIFFTDIPIDGEKVLPDDKILINSTKNNLINFEFEVLYRDKVIYRGVINKPSLTGIGGVKDRLCVAFCFDYNILDSETKLEMAENKEFELVKTKSGKKYLYTQYYTLFKSYYKSKDVKIYDKISNNIRIKFYKLIYK